MRKMTLVSLAASGFFCILLLLNPYEAFGNDIRLVEQIKIDPAVNFEVVPKSFCVTEDKIFLIPDSQGTVKIFNKEGNFLKFIRALGPKIDKTRFKEPWYCVYNRNEGKLGVIDYRARRIFLFKRTGKIEFSLDKDIDCRGFGYDMEFTGDGKQLVVSGYLADSENNAFDLYSIILTTGQIHYLLPSYKKYNLKNYDEYFLEYRQRQTLPAIGIKGFFDIQGDELFFAWEGALRIVKLNLLPGFRETTTFQGRETPDFIRPVGSRLGESYKKGEFDNTWKEQEKMAYVRNIFATPGHIFLIYRTARNERTNTFTYRIQTYTPEGDFQGDDLIPGSPGPQMWFDKESYELYAFSEQPGSGDRGLTILKYQIGGKQP